MSWDDIAFVKKHAPGLPVVIKGVGAWEDVVLAYKYGADAVVLSNHGGRQLDFAQPPMKVLYEVNKNAPQVLHRKNFNIFLDGGVRHGTDVLKALCLGATAVGLGRPFIYAATGWGSDGVEKAVERESCPGQVNPSPRGGDHDRHAAPWRDSRRPARPPVPRHVQDLAGKIIL
jgi:L-lactate dehydrogenase (cytochrome)